MEVNSSLIARENLLNIFNGFLTERVVYVHAPAGYGKTVTVRQWLDGTDYARAIALFDDYDNNVLFFCERFCASLRICQPQNKALAEIVMHPSFCGAPDEFSIRAIAALSQEEETVLVVDDLHLVTNSNVLRLFLTFLSRLPKNFRIILISRNDLPLELSELWIKGSLARVSMNNFKFSPDEIERLYKKRGLPITKEQAEEITQFTGGWAIGINAVLLAGGIPSGRSLDYLGPFIRQNVWEKWDEQTREFMLKTAMLRSLDPPLCEAITGVSDCDKLLYDLMRGGAFVYQTGDGSYRYHHLFQAFLRNVAAERGEEFRFALIKKEAEWYLTRLDCYGAVECFIRCNNSDGIARCFDSLVGGDRNNFVIEKVLPIINAPEVLQAAEKYPFIYAMMAWCALAQGNVENMCVYIDRYYARYHEIARRDPARAHNIFFVKMLDLRLPLSELAKLISKIPMMLRSDGAWASLTMNMPLLHRCTRDFSELSGRRTELIVRGLKTVVGWLFGEEADMLAECLTAGLLYEQGHFEKAYAHAMKAHAAIRSQFAPESKFCATTILIYVMDALKHRDEAETVLARMGDGIERDRAYYLSRNYQSLVMRRKLSAGNISAAREWIAERGAGILEELSLFKLYEAFTTARAYIAASEYNSAIILLTKMAECAKTLNRPMDLIESKILLAIAFWKKKRNFQAEAIDYLEEAVSVASRYGFTQPFIYDGAELAGMLRRLQRRSEQQDAKGAPTSFIKGLYLGALENQEGGLTSGQPRPALKFTDKQKAIMRLLCQGKSYREITEIVGIKLPTLRSHIALIYKKLDVTLETDAVKKIKSLEILSDE